MKLKDGFSQVCIWPACIVVVDDKPKEDKINEFEQLMLDQFKVRVQYLEEIKTKPDYDIEDNKIVEKTGNRNDLFFAVHDEDVNRFAVPRLTLGIRWIEDTLATGNYKCHIYPDRVFKYVTWNKKYIKFPE